MEAEPVAQVPTCVECGGSWLPRDTDRWQAYWIDDGPEDVLLFYCAECATREFGGSS